MTFDVVHLPFFPHTEDALWMEQEGRQEPTCVVRKPVLLSDNCMDTLGNAWTSPRLPFPLCTYENIVKSYFTKSGLQTINQKDTRGSKGDSVV